jgi:SulP family sulfate permease
LELLLTSGSVETPQYSSQGVREQTQELASWVLGDSVSLRSGSPNPFHNALGSESDFDGRSRGYSDSTQGEGRQSLDSSKPDIIEEVSEPQSPEDTGDAAETEAQPSALTNLIRDHSPPKSSKGFLGYGTNARYADSDQYTTPSVIVDDVDDGVTETTTLLPRERLPGRSGGVSAKFSGYGEEMEIQFKNRWAKLKYTSQDVVRSLSHPKEWDLREISSVTIGAVAAVFLGLLLNILDALSYGKLTADLITALFKH